MPMDYVVLIRRPQHFGNNEHEFGGLRDVLVDQWSWGDEESDADDATFVGETKDYAFDCPAVDPSEPAVLLFRSLGVDYEANQIAVNPTRRRSRRYPAGSRWPCAR